jgi:hypothetical protein
MQPSPDGLNEICCRAINRSNCFHRNGHDAPCGANTTVNMTIFAGIQTLLSQLPNFHKLWWLSILAAVMSLAYSSIGLGLSIAKIAGRPRPLTFTDMFPSLACRCNAQSNLCAVSMHAQVGCTPRRR